MPPRPALLVSSDLRTRRLLTVLLPREEYRLIACSWPDAVEWATLWRPEIIIVELPDQGATELVTELRGRCVAAPIILLLERGDDCARLEALDAGADAWVQRPFGINELLSRMRASSGRRDHRGRLSVGDLHVDPIRRVASVPGRGDIPLTPFESRLLLTLMREPNRVWRQALLVEELWGHPAGRSSNSLAVHVRNLRAKLEEDPARPRWILTRPRIGYQLRLRDAGEALERDDSSPATGRSLTGPRASGTAGPPAPGTPDHTPGIDGACRLQSTFAESLQIATTATLPEPDSA